jgi:polar amino acid transport system permease protein
MSQFEILTRLLEASRTTLWITLWASALALVMAFVGGVAKLSHNTLVRWLAVIYIELFRGTSAIVQLFWLFFVLPFFGIELPAVLAGILALGLNVGAYGAEVVRGAILAVPKGQYEAATALNFTSQQRLWRVLIPQAVVNMIPPFGNLAIELLKATSLVSLVTVTDLTYRAQILDRNSFGVQTSSIYFLTLMLYFAFAIVITLAIRSVETRLSTGRNRGRA